MGNLMQLHFANTRILRPCGDWSINHFSDRVSNLAFC